MNISITPELEKFIQDKVNSGMYSSASEVVRDSLRMMHQYDALKSKNLAELNQAINVGLTQLEKGEKKDAQKSYKRLKSKIDKLVQDYE